MIKLRKNRINHSYQRGLEGPPPEHFVISPLEQCILEQCFYVYMTILKRKHDMLDFNGHIHFIFF